MARMFANDPGDWGLIPGQVIQKKKKKKKGGGDIMLSITKYRASEAI